MARITVEDCVEKIPNKFKLVVFAAHRARAIGRGAEITVDRDNDKTPVIALREIAEDNLDKEKLYEDLINSLQSNNKVDIIDEENLHAENQDIMVDEMDLNNEGTHIFEDHEALDLDLDIDHDQIDNLRDDK